MLERCSTTVTLVPSAANIDAYSMPMTPAPTTTMDVGTRSIPSIWSESTMVTPSKSTVSGRAGRVPTAITAWSNVTFLWSPSPVVISISFGPMKAALPSNNATLLRDN